LITALCLYAPPHAPAATAVPAAPAAPAVRAAPAATAPLAAPAAPAARVVPDRPLVFPGDYGSHPDYRTEWWYITGWLTTRGGESLGFQVTFFRARPDLAGDNPSAFAPRQLIIAHAAISDPRRGRLWGDQRIARAGFDLADARVGDTDVWLGPWSLKRTTDGRYTTHVAGDEFSFDLDFTETQRLLLNGNAGVSRKGPSPDSASYYYSLPHLRVEGSIVRAGRTDSVSGEAWLDHEWSSEYLDAQAVGWDWIGINLDDGGALMAFEIRGAHGEPRWTGGSLRTAGGAVQTLSGSQVQFSAVRRWRSPHTGIEYPVAWLVSAGGRQFELQPLLDDQENDTRLSTGAIYWEGAVRVFEDQRPVGRGYLELTGYGEKLRLR